MITVMILIAIIVIMKTKIPVIIGMIMTTEC